MSTRMFDAGNLGLSDEVVDLVVFGFFDFIGDPQFIHSSIGVVTWGEEDWYGVGALGVIEPIKESIGYAPARIRIGLHPVAEKLLYESLNENTWGRLCELYVGTIDENGRIRETPELILRGRMGPPEVQLSANGSVGIVVEDIRASLDRTNGLRAVLIDHQAESSADLFYSLIPSMMDHKFIFNGGSYGPRRGASETLSNREYRRDLWGD